MTDTRWNGEPCTARRITAIVADNDAFPGYWARHLVGTRRNIVEVTYGGSTFYLDDEAGEGWHKVTHGGSPRWAHSNITIDPDTIQPRDWTPPPPAEPIATHSCGQVPHTMDCMTLVLTDEEKAALHAAHLPSGTRVTRTVVDQLLRQHTPGLSRAEEDEAATAYEQAVARVESSGPPLVAPGVSHPHTGTGMASSTNWAIAGSGRSAGQNLTLTSAPAEHCGHPKPDFLGGTPTECVLRPGHLGSHADHNGTRWWKTTEQALEDQDATPAATEATEPERCRICGTTDRLYWREAGSRRPYCTDCDACDCRQDPCVRTGINDHAVSETAALRELRDQLATTLREVLDAFEAYWARASYEGPGQSAVQPEHFKGWRAVLNQHQKPNP